MALSSPGGVRVFAASFFAVVAAMPVTAATPGEDFQDAIRLDLAGKTQLAFSTYLRAAAAGMPQAQFNVAVMLDSGRGVPRDRAEAALWYARAASHGNQRAAFNLGELYDTGEGVPQNTQLSRAWFAESGLPLPTRAEPKPRSRPANDMVVLTAPELVSPRSGSKLVTDVDGVVLVWTAKPQSVPTHFYVEVCSLGSADEREVFSGESSVSSVFAKLPDRGRYAWRVFAVATDGKDYKQSEWQTFTVEP